MLDLFTTRITSTTNITSLKIAFFPGSSFLTLNFKEDIAFVWGGATHKWGRKIRPLISYNRVLCLKLPPRRGPGTTWYEIQDLGCQFPFILRQTHCQCSMEVCNWNEMTAYTVPWTAGRKHFQAIVYNGIHWHFLVQNTTRIAYPIKFDDKTLFLSCFALPYSPTHRFLGQMSGTVSPPKRSGTSCPTQPIVLGHRFPNNHMSHHIPKDPRKWLVLCTQRKS